MAPRIPELGAVRPRTLTPCAPQHRRTGIAVTNCSETSGRREAMRRGLDLVGRAVWHLPGRFGIARWLGPRYALRCVLFHHIADRDSAFTKGLGVTMSPSAFESALKFISEHYTPVRLRDILDRPIDPQPQIPEVLVTFDDAYASVREVAAPLCSKYGIPAVFFVNAAYVGNRRLALDNLVCYVANKLGLEAISRAVTCTGAEAGLEIRSISDVFSHFLPAISLPARAVFQQALLELVGCKESELASEADLYVSPAQLRELGGFGFEVGNHTYTHVNCRHLTKDQFADEIDRNKSELERLSGNRVRSF